MTISKSILDYFPKPYKPRDVQAEALLQIERAWGSSEVIVINLPVASGKSYIAKTILDWSGSGVITTPNNILVDQYNKDFPKLAKLYGRVNYKCSEKGYKNCNQRILAYERAKCSPKTCKGCPYAKDNRRVRAPFTNKYVTNNHMYAQLRKYMPVLIADEAHNLTGFLQDWHSCRISYDKYQYPRSYSGRINRAELKKWLLSMKGIDSILNGKTVGQKAIRELYQELNSTSPRYLLKEEAEQQKDGGYKRYLKLCPIDIRGMPSVLWPGRMRKIVLMSATIGEKDIEELGLDSYRVSYIEAPSCIPAENRPVIFEPCANIKGANIAATIDKVSESIINIGNQNLDSKGLVHATYAQASALRGKLPERYIFHDSKDKRAVYDRFREADDNRVLVASGMYEGIDLAEDMGRWQVIAKIPWPNLGEPAVALRAKHDSDWYSWQSVKTVLQACGRICRTPQDTGTTYIIDGTFKRLYTSNQDMFPAWYKQSVQGV